MKNKFKYFANCGINPKNNYNSLEFNFVKYTKTWNVKTKLIIISKKYLKALNWNYLNPWGSKIPPPPGWEPDSRPLPCWTIPFDDVYIDYYPPSRSDSGIVIIDINITGPINPMSRLVVLICPGLDPAG